MLIRLTVQQNPSNMVSASEIAYTKNVFLTQ